MKHRMSLIVYNGMDGKVFRKDWELPDITAEEFDVSKHMGKVFMHPDGDLPTDQGMYVWQYCIPKDAKEENKLIKMGKWATLPHPGNPKPAKPPKRKNILKLMMK